MNRFLWVKFQLDDLCDAESDAEIKRVLKNLPKDLSETYARLLGRITGSQRQELAKRMLQWIICARRPLHIEELREGIAFTINDQFFDREKLPTDMPRLIRGCGNLVVIDEDTEQVHLAHYTVEQYILLEEGMSRDPCQPYCFTHDDANNAIGETCVAYLSFSDFETQLSKAINKSMVEMAVLQRAAASGTTVNTGRLGTTMRQALALVYKPDSSVPGDSLEINYQHLVPRPGPPCKILFKSYRLLTYIIDNWLFHTAMFKSTNSIRRDRIFEGLILKKALPFTFRPWEASARASNIEYLCLIGWALENDHVPTLRALSNNLPNGLDLVAQELFKREKFFIESIPRISKKEMLVLNSLAQLRTTAGVDDDEQRAWLYAKLILACRQGNLGILLYFLDLGGVWDTLGSDRRGHMLCEAAAYGHQESVELILRKHSHHYHMSPLSITCNYLVDEFETYYFNAIEISILKGYPAIAAIIQEQFPGKIYRTTLIELISSHMGDVLKNGAAVDAILQAINPETSEEKEILHLLHYGTLSEAARSGDLTRVSRHIDSFKLEEPVNSGMTPLLVAISEGNFALLRILTDAGADTQVLYKYLENNTENVVAKAETFDAVLEVLAPTTEEQGSMLHALIYRALSQAARSGDKARIERHLHSIDLERQIRLPFASKMVLPCPFTPLRFAILENDVAVIIALTRAGADTTELYEYLKGDIEEVLVNPAIFEAVLEVLSPMNAEQEQILLLSRYKAISYAARSGRTILLERYLHSFDLEKMTLPQETVLASAISEKNMALVRALTRAGVPTDGFFAVLKRNFVGLVMNVAISDAVLGTTDLNTEQDTTLSKCMRLIRAVQSGNMPLINRIVESLPIVDSPTISAMLESEQGSVSIKVLFRAGTYWNETGNLEAAAWNAVREDDLECLRLFTQMGAYLNTRNEISMTAVDYVVWHKQFDIFYFLIKMAKPGPEIPCSESSYLLASHQWSIDQMGMEWVLGRGIRWVGSAEKS
jgi:hypothetical protein